MAGANGSAAAAAREGPGLQGVGRAFDVLECLAERPMTASEVVEALGVKWATAHRTLSYLRERGYLERDARTGVYAIGPRIYSVGSAYLTHLPMVRIAQPHLKAAAEDANATAQLVRRDGDYSVVLSVFEAANDAVPHASIGYNFPLNCSSKGHVLLAWAEEQFLEDFLSRPMRALTAHSITDPEVLRRRLARVRARGYAVTSRDVRLFSASVSAPVRDATGDVVACVTLIVPSSALRARLQRLVNRSVRIADEVSLMLGWRAPLDEMRLAGGRSDAAIPLR